MWDIVKSWTGFDVFNVVAGLASISGLVISVITLVIASRVKKTLAEIVRQKTRQIRLGETVGDLDKARQQFARALGSNRARSLVPPITASLSILASYLEEQDTAVRERTGKAQSLCEAISGPDTSEQSLDSRLVALNEEVTVVLSLTGALLRDIEVGRKS